MMNQDKLKQMYAEGGLLKALLKDPAQREMARKMLTMEEGGMMKKYRMGGSMEYAEGGEMEPPKGTRSAGEFVRIQEPDLRDAYNTAWVQEYGPIEEGFKKLTPEQRERVLERASMMADRRFSEDLESADDEMAFKTRAYEEGRYSPGSSFMPREAQGNPADLQVMRAENMAIREREKLSPELMRMFGM